MTASIAPPSKGRAAPPSVRATPAQSPDLRRSIFRRNGFATRAPVPQFTNQKNGVSAPGLQRVLGLSSYETAWTWLHKARRAMVRPGRDSLCGTVEVDETYVGGVETGKRGRETETKAIVVVAAEETGKGIGRIRLRRVKDVSGACGTEGKVIAQETHPESRFFSFGWLVTR